MILKIISDCEVIGNGQQPVWPSLPLPLSSYLSSSSFSSLSSFVFLFSLSLLALKRGWLTTGGAMRRRPLRGQLASRVSHEPQPTKELVVGAAAAEGEAPLKPIPLALTSSWRTSMTSSCCSTTTKAFVRQGRCRPLAGECLTERDESREWQRRLSL